MKLKQIYSLLLPRISTWTLLLIVNFSFPNEGFTAHIIFPILAIVIAIVLGIVGAQMFFSKNTIIIETPRIFQKNKKLYYQLFKIYVFFVMVGKPILIILDKYFTTVDWDISCEIPLIYMLFIFLCEFPLLWILGNQDQSEDSSLTQ